MKLHLLTIENITSLKGRSVINFDELLQDQGLFAITGPTGSGKSSILTAISLALYGRNYKALNNDDFVSLGRPKGSISLVFSLGGEKYTALWECRSHKNNGEALKKPRIVRQLQKADQFLEYTPESILNLSFDQFCKTVILNQGEFSRFISSNFSERKAILEKLYNEEKLSWLGQQLKVKIKDLEQQNSNLKIKIETALPYTEEEIENAMVQLQTLETSYFQNQSYGNLLEKLYQNLTELLTLLQKQNETRARRLQLEHELIGATTLYNQSKEMLVKKQLELDNTEKLFRELAPKLTRACRIKEQLTILTTRLHNAEQKIVELTNSIGQAKTQQHELLQQSAVINQQLTALNSLPNISSWSEQDIVHIQSVLKDGQAITQQILLKQNSLTHLQNEFQALGQKQTQLQTEQQELNQQLANITSLQLKEQKQRLIQHAEGLNRLWPEFKTICNDKKQKDEELQIAKKKNLILKNKVEELAKKCQENVLAQQQEQLLRAIHLCQQEGLKKGHCVVCNQPLNSTHMHLAKEHTEFSSLDIQKNAQLHLNAEKELAATCEIMNQLALQLENIEQREMLLKDQLFALDLPPEMPDEQYQLRKEATEKELQATETKLSEQIKLQEKIASCAHTLQSIATELQQNQAAHQQFQNEIHELKGQLDVKLRDSASLLQDYPHVFEEILGHFEKELRLFRELNDKKKSLSAIERHLQLIETNIKNSCAQRDLNQQEKETEHENIKNLNTELANLTALADPQAELERQEMQLRNLQQNKEQLLTDNYNKERHKDRISSQVNSQDERIEELQLAALTIFSKAQATGQQLENNSIENSLPSNLNILYQQCSKALKKFNNIKLENNPSPIEQEVNNFFKETLQSLKEEFSVFLHETQTEISTLRIKINAFQDKQKEQQEALKQVSSIQQKLERLNNLQLVLGNNEFRNFALGLIEDQLIKQANYELNSLCDGRYRLIQMEKKLGHDFYVIDHWNSGLTRKVSTLSGGETFLISLAMALALAEMSRGQTEIDSFFIDEGFGSLDADSIEEALDILMNVRNRGKQIGIISHLSNLTDRITINIALEKNKLGETKINYRFN